MLLLSSASLFVIFAALANASSHGSLTNLRRHQLLTRRDTQPVAPRASVRRKSCSAHHKATSTKPADPKDSVVKTDNLKADTPDKPDTPVKPDTPQGGVAAGNFVATKPVDWPTATQAKAIPTSTTTSAADPFLMELSKALDNSQNQLFTSVHNGEMTYYGQSLGACGDVYNDQSFTAAVSRLMFDTWPGANPASQNRNPICGPFVPGRQTLTNAGTIQVKIVDRCEKCAIDDIDLTPAAFAALADPGPGRLPVTWKFDDW
ncbi:RlpA-like double-psi beta-barrel-protein domain-containing protein-containing protein [Mycena rebaudengoi]|nr:RlpA-like double-psi beta-barrel-protein domain-containing protein-containing protein [Mycena rebaudengoi]